MWVRFLTSLFSLFWDKVVYIIWFRYCVHCLYFALLFISFFFSLFSSNCYNIIQTTLSIRWIYKRLDTRLTAGSMTVSMHFLLTLKASSTLSPTVSFGSWDLPTRYNDCYVLFSESHKFLAAADALFEFCTFKIECILSCSECYENQQIHPNEWRSMTCSKPHIVLWIKLGRNTDLMPTERDYWPAKLLSIDDNEKEASVVFFDHTEFEVRPLNHCILYSENTSQIDANDISLMASKVTEEIFHHSRCV